MSKNMGSFIALALFAAFSFGETEVIAEEILITNNGIHLGWVTSKDKFTTCRRIIMDIGEGSVVEEVKDRCPSFESAPLVKGSVDRIDTPNQILWVKEEGGGMQKLFFFETGTEMKYLEKGNKVIVTVPIPGRAGSISRD